jgi:hypothetical protein
MREGALRKEEKLSLWRNLLPRRGLPDESPRKLRRDLPRELHKDLRGHLPQ